MDHAAHLPPIALTFGLSDIPLGSDKKSEMELPQIKVWARILSNFLGVCIARLYRHNHGNHDRALHGSLEEELGDRIGEVFSCGVEVCGSRVAERRFHALADDEPSLVHEVFVVTQVDEPARDDVGGFVELARAAVYRRDDDTESFLGERF